MTDRTKSILEAVLEVMGITYDALTGPGRDAKLVQARQMLLGLILEFNSEDPNTLSTMLKRDRTTLINTKQKFEDYMLTSREYRKQYEQIKSRVYAQKVPLADGLIYIDLWVQRKEPALELTPHEHSQLPCLSYAAHEIERKTLQVQYKPGAAWLTPDHVIDTTLRAYKRRYKVLSYKIVDHLNLN